MQQNTNKGRIYAEPLRVYVFLGVLALLGLYCGFSLPISLFPNSTKPVVYVWANYGDLTADEFAQVYGYDLESKLQAIHTDFVQADKVTVSYEPGGTTFEVRCSWGNRPLESEREVQRIVDSWTASMPEEIRRTIGVGQNDENGGFFAASFFSDQRSMDDLYDILEPVFLNRMRQLEDAGVTELWNPSRKEIKLLLKPEALTTLQVLPVDIASAINKTMRTLDGGSLMIGNAQVRITMPRSVQSLEDISKIPVATRTGRMVHLGDLALIDYGPRTKNSRIIKTSGSKAILLYATPKPGANIKRMAEELNQMITDGMKHLPADVKFKTLVDPSQFIQSSIANVFHEVIVGSLLAVAILFVFIGSFKNVITAAIEIPLSLVLAFLLMRLFNVNINLISLGGLALSAGMNVDASVVVMENIFRHFDEHIGKVMSRSERLAVIVSAVREVATPVIVSTLASLVVFVPLFMTSDLSYAILGDLAKAVVFSHAFSACVALILVPTVRLHIMGHGQTKVERHESRFEPMLQRVDSVYIGVLKFLMQKAVWLWSLAGVTVAVFGFLVWFVFPKLPTEVIGTPDTDLLVLRAKTKGNTLVKQMEAVSDEVESRLLKKFDKYIDYTFTQINGANRTSILPHLKDKSEMTSLIAALEKEFTNTPEVKFEVEPFSPSELPIPHPAAVKVEIRGRDALERREVGQKVLDILDGTQLFQRVVAQPSMDIQKQLTFTPNLDQWSLMKGEMSLSDLMSYTRTITEGRWVYDMQMRGRDVPIMMRFPDEYVSNEKQIESLPVNVGTRLVPLKALMKIKLEESLPAVYREQSDPLISVEAHVSNQAQKTQATTKLAAEKSLKEWMATRPESASTSVEIVDAGKDVTGAIRQLGIAIGASVFLIFLILLFQFGSFAEPMLVLIAIPTGFLGVLSSLYIFKSNLSLNSALGVILLNGIAVNNSIILVDFTKRLFDEGLSSVEAVLKAARLRLRPILITSLTSILGMMPIALGMGDGGKILQPLGVAVSGGLWISMLLTLIFVPLFHEQYLRRFGRKAP
jgi:hydrophobic/amphiphilic exporter-1 (mainly G- bacteria), HAE1 family